MLRRIIAALLAIGLTALAAIVIVNYANTADARALEGMETDNVYVATEPIPEGTTVEEMGAFVDTQAVPKQFQIDGRVTNLDDLEGRVVVTAIAAGEQLQLRRFATVEELRSRGTFALPKDAENYHQVTIPLENPRALGGSIAPGDQVGVFGSFEIQTEHDYVLDEDGDIIFDERAVEENTNGGAEGSQGTSEDEGDSFTITDLLLHKVLVVRVEGGYVAPPPALSEEGEGDEAQQAAADMINVTLALPAEEAARVIYAKEYGNIWLTLEPTGADDDETRTIVITIPSTGRNVLE